MRCFTLRECVCVCFVVRPSSSFVTFTVRPLTWFALDIYIFFSAFNGVHTHLFVPYIGFYAPKMSKTIFRWLVLGAYNLWTRAKEQKTGMFQPAQAQKKEKCLCLCSYISLREHQTFPLWLCECAPEREWECEEFLTLLHTRIKVKKKRHGITRAALIILLQQYKYKYIIFGGTANIRAVK